MQDINNLFIFASTLKPNIMTKQEIKTELENVIYVLETLENDYAALKLKAVVSALKEDWTESDYYAQQINDVLNIDETFRNLDNIKIR